MSNLQKHDRQPKTMSTNYEYEMDEIDDDDDAAADDSKSHNSVMSRILWPSVTSSAVVEDKYSGRYQ